MTAILRITDGTTRVDLLHGAWRVEEWTPEIAGPKGGGSYSNSPLSDGKRLKTFRWDNVTERMTLSLNTSNQDAAIQQLQTIRRLLVQAHEYWTEESTSAPVYVEVRAAHETNTRYALIVQGMVNEESNPYGQEFAPFFGLTQHATMVDLPLVFERLHWTANAPGRGTCLSLYGQHNWQFDEWAVRDAGPVGTVYDVFETAVGTLLAADTSQLWRSTTGASGSWVAIAFGTGDWDNDPGVVYAFCEDDSANIYAACANGIFRSIDDGLNWVRRTAARNAATPNSIAWNPVHSALWLCDKGQDIYYSTDGAANWTANGLSAVYGEVSPNCIFVTTDGRMLTGIDTTYNYHIYYSRTATLPVTWSSNYMVNPQNIYCFYEPGDGFWYAGGANGVLHRTEVPVTSTVLTWTVAATGFGSTIYDLETDWLGTYYLTDSGYIWYSNDMLSWTRHTVTGSAQFYSILASSSKEEIYAGEPGDVWATMVLSKLLGREASTCNKEVYLANRHQFINYTHAYVYDVAPGPTWTRVFPSTVLPFELLPAVPAQNDALYIGISTDVVPTPGILRNVVFDIGTEAKDLTIAWEYWSGALWSTLEITDNTLSGAQSLGLAGVNSIHFEHAGALGFSATNNGGATPTGYWIRGRVTNVPTAPVCPTQQNRELYAITWPYADFSATALGGDLPAMLRVQIENEADKDGVGLNTDPAEYIAGAFIGLQELSGHENFPGYLLASSAQNQVGVTATLGLATTYAATFTSYPYYDRAVYNPTGADAFMPRVTWDIDPGLSTDFQGMYHAFLRCSEINGAPGNIGIRLRVRSGSGGPDFVTDTQYLWHYNDWALLDFGRITFVKSNVVLSTEVPDLMSVIVECSAEGNTTDLAIYDLMLLPVNGWVGYFDNRSTHADGLIVYNQLLEVDSITNPLYSIRALIKDTSGFVRAIVSTDSTGYMQAKPGVTQRLWALLFSRAVIQGEDDGGGNAAFLTDSSENFIRWGVQAGDLIFNQTDGSRAVITNVQTTRIDGILYGGTDNDWDAGDDYYIVTKAMTARPWLVGRLQMWHNDQYLSARGAR